MALKSDPSEWQVGESSPDDFTADAVVEVVNNEDTSDEEVQRIADADDRQTVQDAVAARNDDSGSDEEEETSDSSDYVGDEEWAEDAGVDDDYNPYKDPDVPSTFIAQQIATELQSGESPTLNAIREGKEDSE